MFAENAAEWQQVADGSRMVRYGACLNLAVLGIIGFVALELLLTGNPVVAFGELSELYQVVSWVVVCLGTLSWFLTLFGISHCEEAPLPSPARYFAFARGLFWFALVVSIFAGIGIRAEISIWSVEFVIAAVVLRFAWQMSFLGGCIKITAQREGRNRQDQAMAREVALRGRLGSGLGLAGLVAVTVANTSVFGANDLNQTFWIPLTAVGVIGSLLELLVALTAGRLAHWISNQPAVIERKQAQLKFGGQPHAQDSHRDDHICDDAGLDGS